MILDMHPVAHLQPITIERNLFPLEKIGNHQRDKFFRKGERSIIIGSIRNRDRKFICMRVGADEMVRARFGSTVGTPWVIGRHLGKGWGVGRETSEYLISRDMMKTSASVPASRFEKLECSHHICLNKGLWSENRTVYMRFSCKMHNRINFGEERIKKGTVSYTPLHKTKTRIIVPHLKTFEIPRIRQRIQNNHFNIARFLKD